MWISGIIIVLLIIAGIFLLNGKGSWMIAGFNTLSPEEKKKYNRKALCRFMAIVVFLIALSMGILMLTDWAGYPLPSEWFGLINGVIILFALVYANTGDRFKYPPSERGKEE